MIFNKIKSALINPFIFLIFIVLFGACSMMEGRKEAASVSFKLDNKTVQKIQEAAAESSYSRNSREAAVETLHIDVSVHGDYEKNTTIALNEEAVFDTIPAGSKIYIKATAYKQENGQRIDLYDGRSKDFTVRNGENQVVFVLKRVKTSGGNGNGGNGGNGNGGNGGNGNGGENGGGNGGNGNGGNGGNNPDPDPVLTIDLYVSAANGSSTGAGTEADPLDTIEHAAEKLNDSSKDWVIGIDGLLSSVQNLADPASDVLSAKSITLVGVSGTPANDGIDAGWNGVSTPTGTVGSALTIKTTIPVTLRKLTIKGGDALKGGGLIMDENTTCSVTMIQSYITGNAAVRDGGGVYVGKGTLTLKSGEISSNKTVYVEGVSGDGYGNGGGVLLYQGGAVFDMQDGSVKNNTASNLGGAVYIASRGYYGTGSFIMSGGSISENDCGDSYSNAVFVPGPDFKNHISAGYFEMSGSAVITSDNDVYLEAGLMGGDSVITISGPLTGEAPVATITGYDPGVGSYMNNMVLSETGNGSVASSYNMFAVNPCGSTLYYIDNTGCLTTTQPHTINLYIKAGGNDSAAGTSEATALLTFSTALGKMTDDTADYVINIIGNISRNDNNNFQPFEIPDTVSAKSITIKGDGTNSISGNYDSEECGSFFNVYAGIIPVTFENIKLTGACAGSFNDNDYNGGCIYINAGSTVILGEGAYLHGGRNSNAYGGAVYVAYGATLIIKSSAVVEPDDTSDIFLEDGAMVTIGSNLTGDTVFGTSGVAQITLETYDENQSPQVLDETSSGLISNNFTKFILTQPPAMPTSTGYEIRITGQVWYYNNN